MKAICRWTRRRLPLLAGGDLIGSERRAVERHLVGCAGCRSRLESARRAVAVLHEAAAETMSAPSLWPALERQIQESRRPEPSPWPRRIAWSSAAVAASVLLALAMAVTLRTAPRSNPPMAANDPVYSSAAADPANSPSTVARNEPRRRGRYDGSGVSVLLRPAATNTH